MSQNTLQNTIFFNSHWINLLFWVNGPCGTWFRLVELFHSTFRLFCKCLTVNISKLQNYYINQCVCCWSLMIQFNQDWASCLPCNSNSTAWFHDSVRFINNYPISFGQKSWCNLRWPADLQRAHCKDCSILQVCTTQHQKDQALSDRACCTTSCPGPCHF